MRLNTDCVREVLLYIEEYTYITMDEKKKPVKHTLSSGSVISTCEDKGFSAEDAFYSIYVLAENGYIDASSYRAGGEVSSYDIKDLTLKGHEFLDSIRSPEVYSGVKTIAERIGGITLETLCYAGKVAFAEFVKRTLGIT